MAIDSTSSPYDVIIGMVRSEIADLLSADIGIDDLDFTDDDIAKEINYAMRLKIYRDFGKTFLVTNDALDPLILDSEDYLYPVVIQTALRLIQQKRMIAASENIDLRKTGTSISTKSLVQGLADAEKSLIKKYQSEALYSSGGFVVDMGLDGYYDG